MLPVNGLDSTRPPVRSEDVTGIDWLIVGVVVLLGLFGWAQGFVAGALALLGFTVGAWVGTRVGPLLLDDGRRSPWSPAFGLIGALIAGMVFALGFEGLGSKLRVLIRGPLAALDGMAGAVLTACVGLGIAWVLGALALANGGEARREVQRSTILQHLNAHPAAVERADRRARAARSVPAHRRARGARAGTERGDRARRGRTGGGRQRGEDPR